MNEDAARAVGLAVAASAIGMMPPWLVSALAVQIGESLPLTEAGLGLAVAAFMGTSMVVSIPAGHWVRAVGWRRGVRALAVVGVLANGAVVLVTSTGQLLGLMVLGGVANAVAQPAANLGIVETVSTTRHGLAFGIKQAGTPGSMLLAGAAVPAIGLTLGWRWAFGGLALGCLVLAVLVRTPARPGRAGGRAVTARVGRPGRLAPPRRRALAVLSVSGAVATAAATSLAAFTVAHATSRGIGPAAAGALVAVASALNVVVRLVTGWSADRRPGGQLVVVAVTILVAALGYAILATAGGPVAVVVGTLVAFVGWGWNGLFHLATMREFTDHAAPATGVIVAAMAVGGAIGPAGFGVLVELVSYPVAWTAAAVVAIAASGLVLAARTLLRSGRVATGPLR